ncbi:MIR motif-containing protein [Gorgonomyces haynaldii]|nr:MIR motif-containing protein [Gorgonomyces haynaldii]
MLLVTLVAAEFILEKEFEAVTCGSWIKLGHKPTQFRLHSHEVNYGSGSGQQSVTGYSKRDDSNSYFQVFGPQGTDCVKGTPIACESTVRLMHTNTQKFLHSHSGIQSPLSQHQEVSCNAPPDNNDHWTVKCNTKTWKREQPIALQHTETKQFLSASHRHVYQSVIQGQLEVYCSKYQKQDEQWIAEEGIYISSDQS